MTEILANSRILGNAPVTNTVRRSASLESVASPERTVLYDLIYEGGMSVSPRNISQASPAPCPLSFSGSLSVERTRGGTDEESSGEEARVRQRRAAGLAPQGEISACATDCVVAADCDFSPASSPRQTTKTSFTSHGLCAAQTRYSQHAPSFITDVSTSSSDSIKRCSFQTRSTFGSGRRCPPSSSSAEGAGFRRDTSCMATGVVGCDGVVSANPVPQSSCCSVEEGSVRFPTAGGLSMDSKQRQQYRGTLQMMAPLQQSSNSVSTPPPLSVVMSSCLRPSRKEASSPQSLPEEQRADSSCSRTPRRRPAVPSRLASFFISGLSVCGFMCGCLYLFRWLCGYLVTKMSAELLLAGLNILCPLTSLLLYASPIAAVIKAVLDKEDRCLPVRLFVVQGVANVLAIDYGIKTKHRPIYLTNLAGLLIQLVWLAGYNYIRLSNTAAPQWPSACEAAEDSSSQTASLRSKGAGVLHRFTVVNGRKILKGKFWQYVWAQLWKGQDGTGWLSFVACSVSAICALLYVSSFFSVEAVGMACTVSTVMLVTVPLTGLGNMIRSKTNSSLPLATVLMMVLCNGAWGMYGNTLNDPVLYVPSLIGFLLSLFLLLVVLWCRNLVFGWVDFAILFSFFFAASSRQMANEQQQGRHQQSAWLDSEDYYDSSSPSYFEGYNRPTNADKFSV